MKPTIDRSLCIGCGLCASMAPDVFELDDEGISTVIGEVDPAERGMVLEAAEACPTDAIFIDGVQE